jgi:hypothetical protein
MAGNHAGSSGCSAGDRSMSDRACLYACLAQFIIIAIAFAIINA